MIQMKKILINMGVIFFVALAFASCEKNEPILYSEKIVSFDAKSLEVPENSTSVFPAKMFIAGTEGDGGSEVTLEVSTEGLANPAVEGEDFTIDGLTASFATYHGMDSVMITPIDNEDYEGNKQFMLIMSSASNGYELGSWDTLTVNLIDNEHPLALVIGTYNVAVTDAWGDDASTTITTTAIDGTVEQVQFPLGQFAPGWGMPADYMVYADVDLEAQTFKILTGQSYDTFGYGPCKISGYYGDSGEQMEDGEYVNGTIDANGNITLTDYIGVMITEGNNEGASFTIWAPGAVWTKTGKAVVTGAVNSYSASDLKKF
jgi:hypothetical protein